MNKELIKEIILIFNKYDNLIIKDDNLIIKDDNKLFTKEFI
jgi:hypothetical protein